MTDDEGPSDRGKAKEHVKQLLDKPEHKKPKGSPDDEATRDDAVPNEEKP